MIHIILELSSKPNTALLYSTGGEINYFQRTELFEGPMANITEKLLTFSVRTVLTTETDGKEIKSTRRHLSAALTTSVPRKYRHMQMQVRYFYAVCRDCPFPA